MVNFILCVFERERRREGEGEKGEILKARTPRWAVQEPCTLTTPDRKMQRGKVETLASISQGFLSFTLGHMAHTHIHTRVLFSGGLLQI